MSVGSIDTMDVQKVKRKEINDFYDKFVSFKSKLVDKKINEKYYKEQVSKLLKKMNTHLLNLKKQSYIDLCKKINLIIMQEHDVIISSLKSE